MHINKFMTKRMKRNLLIALLFGCGWMLTGCETPQPKPAESKSIVILYEDDAHCAIEGYAKMRGLKDAILSADTSYVAVVSSGDFINGQLLGSYSHGQYIMDVMKLVGYDAVTLGNHEFDFGVPTMHKLLNQLNTAVVSTNLYSYGASAPEFTPYTIKQYGNKQVAFVGVTTPEAMESLPYSFFDEDGRQLYDMRTKDVFNLVQAAVDQARKDGADYVILLSHLGEETSDTGVDANTLIAATRGIDAVLDGHTHSVIRCRMVANIDGDSVPVSQAGAEFVNIGHLWINKEGKMAFRLIADADNPYTNDQVKAAADSIYTLLNQATSRKVAHVDFDMTVKDADGVWITRHRECTMGNLVADAFRAAMKADIGLVNGGAMRGNFKAGDINYGHVYAVLPHDNYLCLIRATGAQIQTMLNRCCAKCPAEEGQFPHVAGLKYTIHTASHTVTDVQVLNCATETYEPLDDARTYTIGVSDFYRQGGFYDILHPCPLLSKTEQGCRDVLADYLEKTLHGLIPDDYRNTQGRITILDD